MKPPSRNYLRLLLTAGLAAGLLAVAGCEWPPMEDDSDFGQKAMERHYQNGEMSDYEYKNGSQVFKPQPKPPAATPAAKPAATAGTAQPASSAGTANP